MKRLLFFGIALIIAFAGPARADVSFTQIVQSQTSQGEDGLFGKTWIEVSGRKMRIVSGFAAKLASDRRRKTAEPSQFVQILDLDTTSLLILSVASKTYETRGLSELRYADSLHEHVVKTEPDFALVESTVTVERGELRRPCLETECEHFHILVELKLRGPDGKPMPARMAQDVWMAPVAGALQKSFLDLITFEAAYRKLTHDAFTPLDYETYQVREAAAYLHISRKQLAGVLAQVKNAFVDIPGYPMSSNVSWWRQERAEDRPPTINPPRPPPKPKAAAAAPHAYSRSPGRSGRGRFSSRSIGTARCMPSTA